MRVRPDDAIYHNQDTDTLDAVDQLSQCLFPAGKSGSFVEAKILCTPDFIGDKVSRCINRGRPYKRNFVKTAH